MIVWVWAVWVQRVPAGRANGPLKGGKTLTTEGGTRVPCFFHFPAKIQKGSWHEGKGFFHVTDLLPTLVALAGGNTAKTRPLVSDQHSWRTTWDPA